MGGGDDETSDDFIEWAPEDNVPRYTSFASAFMEEQEPEETCTMSVEEVILGALSVDMNDRKSLTAKTALSRATTSSSLSQEIGELLTNESFFDENDETQEIDTDDSIMIRMAQKKNRMQVMLARMLHNISKANVRSKKRRKKQR